MADQPAPTNTWIRETRPNGTRNLWAQSRVWYVIATGPIGVSPSGLQYVWFGVAGSSGPRTVADVAIDYEARQTGLPDVTADDLAWLRGAA